MVTNKSRSEFEITRLLFLLCCVALLSRTGAFLTRGCDPATVQTTTPTSQTQPRRTVRTAIQNNPNDNETPEERQARMELVRKIQATFYSPSSSKEGAKDDNLLGTATAAVSDDENARWLQTDPNDPTIMYNVPLWRVQWTELIGYQNVLNVHVPHYTHMFRTLLLQHPKPWYFGHVFLPGGSENLGNPDYFLPEQEERPDDPLPSMEQLKRQAKVTVTGTLMQVTDYIEQDDGRLTLIVQAVDRFRIITARQQVPYAVAGKIRLVPDQESWEQHVWPNIGEKGMDFELSESLTEATQAVAVKESELFRDLEYYTTTISETTQKQPTDRNIPEGVSPLSNVNASVSVDFDDIEYQMKEALLKRMAAKADEHGSDEIMIAAPTMKLENISGSDENIVSLERDIWVSLDRMLTLLEKANPNVRIPVPTQLLGLLPTDGKWPQGFRLENYANSLEATQSRVGTFSKSPFCRLSKAYPSYPPLRRASRLSYTAWILLDTISTGRDGITRQDLLQMASVQKRLQATLKYIEAINAVIQQMIE
eukprot:scaffold630_cov174-Amphora_coffeaeformis.AAC.32